MNVRGKSIQIGMEIFRATSPSPIWIFWISVTEGEEGQLSGSNHASYHLEHILQHSHRFQHVKVEFQSILLAIHFLRPLTKMTERDRWWIDLHRSTYFTREGTGQDTTRSIQMPSDFEFGYIDFLEKEILPAKISFQWKYSKTRRIHVDQSASSSTLSMSQCEGEQWWSNLIVHDDEERCISFISMSSSFSCLSTDPSSRAHSSSKNRREKCFGSNQRNSTTSTTTFNTWKSVRWRRKCESLERQWGATLSWRTFRSRSRIFISTESTIEES